MAGRLEAEARWLKPPCFLAWESASFWGERLVLGRAPRSGESAPGDRRAALGRAVRKTHQRSEGEISGPFASWAAPSAIWSQAMRKFSYHILVKLVMRSSADWPAIGRPEWTRS